MSLPLAGNSPKPKDGKKQGRLRLRKKTMRALFLLRLKTTATDLSFFHWHPRSRPLRCHRQQVHPRTLRRRKKSQRLPLCRSKCRFAWQAWRFLTFSRVCKRIESRFVWRAPGPILLRRFQKMRCSLRDRRSTLETSIVILRGKRNTSDVSRCVFLRIAMSELRDLVTPCKFRGRRSMFWHGMTLHTLHSTRYTLHSTLYTLQLDSTHYTPHSTLYTLHSRLNTLHFPLHTPLCTLHSTLYTQHFTLHTSHFLFHALHSTIYTPYFTVYTPHFTLHSPYFTLYTPHFTVYTLHFALCTLHSTLHTLHSTLQTLHSTLYTLHSTLDTPHYTLHTLHSALDTLHFTLNT